MSILDRAVRRGAMMTRAAVVLVQYVLVEVGLRLASVPGTARAAGLTLSADGARTTGDFDLSELSDRERTQIRVTLRVLRQPFVNGTCLRQSILVGHVLRQRSPRLVLGVRKIDGEVTAHAWLRIGDLDLDLDRGQGFVPIAARARGMK